MKFDLKIFQPDGQQTSLMGFESPKQRVRGRETDLLLVFLSLKNSSEPIDALKSELEELANAFFRTSGSVTKAIREFVDGLNRSFMQKNHRFDQPESWQTASLSLGVIHQDTLFLAQIGASQALVFSDEKLKSFFDETLDQRGLGVATVTNPRYYQLSLKGNETVIFTAPFEDETAELDDISLVIGELTLRMEENQALGIAQIKVGSGQVETSDLCSFDFVSLLPSDQKISNSVEKPTPPEVPPEVESAGDEQETIAYEPSLAEDLFGQAVFYQQTQQEQLPEEGKTEVPSAEPEPVIDEVIATEDQAEPLDLDQDVPAKRELELPDFEMIKDKALQGVATGAGWLRNVEDKAETIVSAGKQTGATEPIVSVKELPPLTKALIAILVPLLIVFVAAMVFFNRGEDHEYAYYLAQAQASVNNAALMQTTELQREGWEQALVWLDQAAAYQDTAEVQALRQRVQIALDELDGARRLQYVPAFAAGLYPDLEISAIVSLNNDLYLLDQASGSVKYLRLFSSGYEMDSEFVCGPGTYEGVQVGELVDLINIPLNNPAKAPVMAIDAEGNLIYCSPGSSPSAAHLPAPEIGWNSLTRMTFDSNRLYVLDPGNKALWIYRGFTANFNSATDAYFDEELINLSDAVDFEVEGEELFLLHADGHSSHCLASFVTGETSCDDPYPYLNAGTSGANVDFATLKFEQIAYSPPPDPSIYYLEAEKAELYQFSLRLNLNKVLRSGVSEGVLPKGKASAFYVSPDRRVFLAFGNQLYYAVLP
jgi:hypothetical protein